MHYKCWFNLYIQSVKSVEHKPPDIVGLLLRTIIVTKRNAGDTIKNVTIKFRKFEKKGFSNWHQ